jgi:hypothetical protein
MLLEVQIQFSEYDNDYEVNVWDQEDGERVEDLERVFPTEEEATDYVKSLIKNKRYVVTQI